MASAIINQKRNHSSKPKKLLKFTMNMRRLRFYDKYTKVSTNIQRELFSEVPKYLSKVRRLCIQVTTTFLCPAESTILINLFKLPNLEESQITLLDGSGTPENWDSDAYIMELKKTVIENKWLKVFIFDCKDQRANVCGERSLMVHILQVVIEAFAYHTRIEKLSITGIGMKPLFPQIKFLAECSNTIKSLQVSVIWKSVHLCELAYIINKKENIKEIFEVKGRYIESDDDTYEEFFQILKSKFLRKIYVPMYISYINPAQSAKQIFQILKNCPTLREIKISVDILLPHFKPKNIQTTLQKVDINVIDMHNIDNLIAFLKENKQLEIMKIESALGLNKDNEELKIGEIKELTSEISSLRNLKYLSWFSSYAELQSAYFPIILKSLPTLKALHTISLSHGLTDSLLHNIFSILKTHPSIKYVKLTHERSSYTLNNLTLQTQYSLEDFMKKNKIIEKLEYSLNWDLDSYTIGHIFTLSPSLRVLKCNFTHLTENTIRGFWDGMPGNCSMYKLLFNYGPIPSNYNNILHHFIIFLEGNHSSNLEDISFGCSPFSLTMRGMEVIDDIWKNIIRRKKIWKVRIKVSGGKDAFTRIFGNKDKEIRRDGSKLFIMEY